MLFAVLKFAVGLVILLFSTEKFVKLAERIAQVLKVSPLIIGLTVVAIGTSIPELVVSVISTSRQDTGLAMGNIMGANITNILLIFPVGILIGKLKIGRIKTQYTALFLLGATIVFFITHTISMPHYVSGLILLGLASFFSWMEYRLGVIGREHEDSKRFHGGKSGSVSKAQIIIAVFLLVLVVFGGSLVVEGVETISVLTGITTSVLGLTLTSIATTIPELLTTIYSQNNHQEKITVGNVLGSNVYNLLLIGGILMIFPSTPFIPAKAWMWLGGVTAGFVLTLRYYSGRNPPKWLGLIILLLFFVYLSTQ